MKEDKEQLQAELKDKIDKKFSKKDSIDKMLQSVLENFAYRYIATEDSGQVKAVKSGDHTFFVEAFEKNMKQALRCSHKGIYQGIVELLQRVPLKQKPAVKYRIFVQLIQKATEKEGRAKVSAWVNWDYPNFSESSKQTLEKQDEFSFDDFMELRNSYPLALEKVCEIF